jgi:hypothetical protein
MKTDCNTESCYECINKIDIPGDAHIGCNNPDPTMTGHPIGIERRWFLYPFNFDPIWMTKKCANFKKVIE